MADLKLLENQGYSSTTYILDNDRKKYIIKVFNASNINRQFEFLINMKASKLDIGAKPIYLNQENSIMIYEYLEGKHKIKLKTKDIQNIALLLKKVHKIKIKDKKLNFKKDYVLCHHDLNKRNFIFSDKVKLIDWEYACLDDKYFDLATTIIEFNLNKKEEDLFLKTYFKNKFHINRKKIFFFKMNYLNLCIQWFSKEDKIKEKISYKKKLLKILKKDGADERT